jgi:hypothetical protein
LTCAAYNAGWGHSGTATHQQLPAGQDGWVEVMMTETNSSRMIGFSKTNKDANYTSMDYAFYPYSDGHLYIYEGGNRVTSTYFSSYATGDVLRIERTGTAIKYYRNGTLLRTSTVASTSSLMVDVAMYTYMSTLGGIWTSFGTTTTRRFVYDHAGRLLKTWHKINLEPEILLTGNEYNEVGQLVDKKLHSTQATTTDARQSIDYRYNIRGWITSMNNASLTQEVATNDDTGDLFGFELGYNEDIGLANASLFNGNISAMRWSNNLGMDDVKEKAYQYSYDPMNRLAGAAYKERGNAWALASNGGFSESDYGYDTL